MQKTAMKLPRGWYIILDSKEVGPRPLGILRFGIPLVAWRKASGEAVVMSDLCPHRGAKLSLGEVKDGCIECPFHGFRFAPDGHCSHVPEIKRDAPGIRAGVFEVREESGWIWIHFGGGEVSQVLPAFESKRPLLHVNRLTVDWPVHFSRSVENQLDYAHLPFVHRTSIGRFANPGAELRSMVDSERIQWSMGADRAGIEFVFPNLWMYFISEKYYLTLAFVPVDGGTTRLYLRSHRANLTLPPFSWVVDIFDRLLNRWILGQDRRVVVSQEPANSLDSEEKLVGSDQFIRRFREWLGKQ